MMTDADSVAVFKALCLVPEEALAKFNPNRDERGRFASAAASAGATITQHLIALKDHAVAIGARAVGFVQSTKLIGVNPTIRGGLQFALEHATPSGSVRTLVQLHHDDLPNDATLRRSALGIGHSALTFSGRPSVEALPSSAPAVSVHVPSRERKSSVQKSMGDPRYLGRTGISGQLYR
jgi:hypothetical protein